jgi:transposase
MDESGLLMAPLLRRSWAPRGEPPALPRKANHREKVSVAAALWLSPARDRLGLAYRTLPNAYFGSAEVAEFLSCAAPALGAPAVVVWDRGNMHRGEPIEELVRESGGMLELEPLPAHGWDLMPVEQLWAWLKYSRLSNCAARDAADLEGAIQRELGAIADDQRRLQNFVRASALPLPRRIVTDIT